MPPRWLWAARRRDGRRPFGERLRELSTLFGSQLKTVYSTAHAIEELVRDADLVVGAVLIAGAAAPEARHARHGQDA